MYQCADTTRIREAAQSRHRTHARLRCTYYGPKRSWACHDRRTLLGTPSSPPCQQRPVVRCWFCAARTRANPGCLIPVPLRRIGSDHFRFACRVTKVTSDAARPEMPSCHLASEGQPHASGLGGRSTSHVLVVCAKSMKGGRMSNSLVTDFYELNMAASYLRHEMTETATFSLFCRRLPRDRGFLVAAGLEDCLSFLEVFAFDEADLGYLASIGFDEDALRHFRSLRFTGDVWAVPEGSIVFADEPLLEVTAPIAEAQLVETYLLNQCTFQTALATKAARCRIAAAGRIELMDFSIRRTHGVEAGMAVARFSAMCGFEGTSNERPLAASHSGRRARWHTLTWSPLAMSSRRLSPSAPTSPIRQSSSLTPMTRRLASLTRSLPSERSGSKTTPASGSTAVTLSISPDRPADVLTQPDSVGSASSCPEGWTSMISPASSPRTFRSMLFGIGTRLGVSDDAPYVDTAYKLVEYAGRPVVKLSPGKATLPGPKQVFRNPGLHDTIACRDEMPPRQAVPLLELVMTAGKRTHRHRPLTNFDRDSRTNCVTSPRKHSCPPHRWSPSRRQARHCNLSPLTSVPQLGPSPVSRDRQSLRCERTGDHRPVDSVGVRLAQTPRTSSWWRPVRAGSAGEPSAESAGSRSDHRPVTTTFAGCSTVKTRRTVDLSPGSRSSIQVSSPSSSCSSGLGSPHVASP